MYKIPNQETADLLYKIFDDLIDGGDMVCEDLDTIFKNNPEYFAYDEDVPYVRDNDKNDGALEAESTESARA